jgi:uncharacterized protein (TIGR02680 family)
MTATAEPVAAARLEPSAWLEAALGSGLPEPVLTRWQPLRVGIVNLWEYDNAEFWFADGRMVLRGGNGAGKTKVLELTTLMLMRGEIAPSILDPFGSQHRSMKYNLLPSGEADDPREPADSGLGYAWVEFGRRDTNGECRYFVCGLGASARRGTGTSSVTPWQFVTALRPGTQLRLVNGGYPVEEKELKKLDGVWVRNNATQYRERLARELFELDLESYDNLTELLKQLRKPKLGERLNPTSLAETLRDSLPPLAGHEVTQLAEGWDHLDLLRRAVEQTEQSAAAVAAFVRTGWRPWVRATVRRRADALAEATTVLDNTTRNKRQAEQTLAEAKNQLVDVEGDQAQLSRARSGKQTEREELIESQAYRDAVVAAQRVEQLRGSVNNLRSRHADATRRLDRAERDARRAQVEAVNAERTLAEADSEVDKAAATTTSRAPAAGLADSAERHLGRVDAASLWSDLDARNQRFDNLRQHSHVSVDAERAVEDSARILKLRGEEAATAAREETAATEALAANVRQLQGQIRTWASQATVSACDAHQVEAWCDDVTVLTQIDPDGGTVLSGGSVVAAIQVHVDRLRDALIADTGRLRRERDPLAVRDVVVSAELAVVRAATETAPLPPELWRRRDRPEPGDDLGAPLWRCVQPVHGLADGVLDLVEPSLAASGLLDAWLDPGQPRHAHPGPLDTILGAGAPRREETLAAVLTPTPAGGVPAARISAVLASIGWYPTPPSENGDDRGPWLAADGHWRIGQLRGRVEPAAPASYIGATAREAARQRRITAIEHEQHLLRAAMADIDAKIDNVESRLTTLAAERLQIPDEVRVRQAVAVLTERARRRMACDAKVSAAAEQHREDVGRRDEAVAALARFASEHRFPTTGLEVVDKALRQYGDALARWQTTVEVRRARAESAATAKATAGDRQEHAEAERAGLDQIDEAMQAETIRFNTATQQLGSDHAERLQRRTELDEELRLLTERGKELDTRQQTAWQAAWRANTALEDHENRRQAAESSRDSALAAWWQVVDAGLVGALGFEPPARRIVESALTGARAVRRDVDVAADAAAIDRAWRRCFSELETLRQHLLPNRDARTDDGDDTLPPRVFILAEPGAGWQLPDEASDTLAERVRTQRDAYDVEQHKVLTTLLESTFIEHLKDRLDHTERTFTRINATLAQHPTRRGHAVRLVWQADPVDPDAGAVVSALRQGYQELIPERQEMVRGFLARRIEEARSDVHGPADWKDRLAAALDYRLWLRITLQYRSGPGGSWAVFDVAKHGAKSGGEKVVLLSQPLFAAAVVAYDAAGPNAPRWVWLDEAMTGVDTQIKASFMGLTVGFDLDIMLTAFDEWCKYESVPAVAIYDLSRHPHLPGVDSQPYLWCGGEEFRIITDSLGVSRETTEANDDLLSLLDEGQ